MEPSPPKKGRDTRSTSRGATKDADTLAVERDLAAALGLAVSIEHDQSDLATRNIIFEHHLRFEANP